MRSKLVAMMCCFFANSVVYAECPTNMDANKLIECITIEGSGANYQQWKKDYDKSVSNDGNKQLVVEDN